MEVDAAIDSAARSIGLEALKPTQREVIRSFTSGRDVFVALPTGYGKSFCFVLLPLVFDRLLGRSGSIVLCVSPLTSLMMEQRAKYGELGIVCEFVGELQQDIESIQSVQKGLVQLLFISPESLISNPQWREMLLLPQYQERTVALVVDEAHCIALWGEDFRTDYGRIGELRALLPPSVHVMALTATATRGSRKKILASLCMANPALFCVSPHKKNILYTVHPKPTLEEFVGTLVNCLKIFRTFMPRTIIFCKRYKECAQMYDMFEQLLQEEFTDPPNAPNLVKYRLVDMYTKCTEASIKKNIVEEFSKADGVLRIVIGTIAFGMGLDCPDVRQVLHWGASHDIESYIQETGRCGRDGYMANAVLFHSETDEKLSSPQMVEYCQNEKVCRRDILFCDFDNSDTFEKPCSLCMCCDVCAPKCTCEMCMASVYLVPYAFTHNASLQIGV